MPPMCAASPPGDSDQTQELLAQVRAGHAPALDELLTRHRPFLRHMVELYLDPRLRQRVDPSDVVQDAQLEAARRIEGYLAEPALPFRLWLRRITYDRLLMLRRRHHGAQQRAVARELPLPEGSAVQLAQRLLADVSTPSEAAIQSELARRVQRAVQRLAETDRDLVLMRSFEGLSNQEVAEVLGVEPAAASKRFGRALLRLRTLLMEGGVTESTS